MHFIVKGKVEKVDKYLSCIQKSKVSTLLEKSKINSLICLAKAIKKSPPCVLKLFSKISNLPCSKEKRIRLYFAYFALQKKKKEYISTLSTLLG